MTRAGRILAAFTLSCAFSGIMAAAWLAGDKWVR